MCSEVLPGACCHYCGDPAETRDHIVPRSRITQRPAPGAENLVPACKICNLVKGDLPSTCQCQKCRAAWWRFGPDGWQNLPEVNVIDKGNWKRRAMGLPTISWTAYCRVWDPVSAAAAEEDRRLAALRRARQKRLRRQPRQRRSG